ncbi:MAG: zinc ribbon domain-containing protein [Coriobacteriia bacterium]|nr:zinc ribbon domain-containing protein [Coriobacteriia bacterium]
MAGLLGPILSSGAFRMVSLALGILCLVITLALIYWLRQDAKRRSAGALVWTGVALAIAIIGALSGFAFMSFGFGPVGLIPFVLVCCLIIIYVVIRPAEFTADARERDMSLRLLSAELESKSCPRCGAGIEAEFLICPECLIELRHNCDYCGRPVKPSWQACPYCRSRQQGGAASSNSKSRPARTRSSSPSNAGANTDKGSSAGAGSFGDLDLTFN